MRARQLNPAETAQFQADMASLPPQHQADVALKWRERCVNALTTYVPTPAKEALQFTSAAIYSGVMGWWDGDNDTVRRQLIDQWLVEAPAKGIDTSVHKTPFRDVVNPQTGQVLHKAVADPRNMYGVNKTLYPTLGLVLGSIGLAWAGKGLVVTPYLKSAALAGGGYLIGTTFRDLATDYRTSSGVLASAGNGASNGNGGPVGNPCGGYPRAA